MDHQVHFDCGSVRTSWSITDTSGAILVAEGLDADGLFGDNGVYLDVQIHGVEVMVKL